MPPRNAAITALAASVVLPNDSDSMRAHTTSYINAATPEQNASPYSHAAGGEVRSGAPGSENIIDRQAETGRGRGSVSLSNSPAF